MNSSTSKGVGRVELQKFFAEIGSRMKPAEAATARAATPPPVSMPALRHFFKAINRQAELAETKQRLLNRHEATGFNVFDFIEPDDNKLSDVLAMLLDPNGSHGQGDLFLRLLFKQLGINTNVRHTQTARVRREAPTHGILKYRRRMDVLIDAGALVAIENKTDSLEQPKQVEDYLEHLLHATRGRSFLSCLIYLTPNGRPPDSLGATRLRQELADGRLRCWSYHRELRAWLENCHRGCEARRIRDFLTDLMAYIAVELQRASTSPDQDESNED